MKKSLISLTILSIANFAQAGLEDIDNPIKIATFYEYGDTFKMIDVYAGSNGTSCPRSYVIVEDGKETDPFGTCAEELINIVKYKDEIYLNMNGFAGPFESQERQERETSKFYHFIYKNGEITKTEMDD
ncbi:hypothetical protein [Lonepinella sp. MS14436]|uniref:hypothetical protein n=1 Tax=Lonepinella sp. MS14436 TaxID=3003619 RepID=UPI0036DBD1FA